MNRVLENIQLKKRRAAAPMLERIKQELVRSQRVLYGGTAQNLHLPNKHRFYKDTDIPDYDVYSYKAKAFAVRLARKLRLEVRCSKNHAGTYKLYHENVPVLDVSDVGLAEFRRLRTKGKKTPDGLLLAPIELLKANAYLELASPDTAWFRWEKVYERIDLLERILKNTNFLVKSPSLNQETGSLITGFHAARFHLGLPFEPELAPLRFTNPDRCIATDPKNKDYASLFHVLHLGYLDLYEQGHTDIPVRALLKKVSEKKLHSRCVGTDKVHKRSKWTFKAS